MKLGMLRPCVFQKFSKVNSPPTCILSENAQCETLHPDALRISEILKNQLNTTFTISINVAIFCMDKYSAEL